MAINHIESIEGYVKFLHQFPAETELLFRDMLIGVTSFFRDPDDFKSLEQLGIAKLLDNKRPGSAVRIWIPCCSTGEEAYSIAIMIQEYMERLESTFQVQIFATDIDSYAISAARAGKYPASISLDITRDRLERFFIAESDGREYRICKGIRDMLIFSEQNLIKDPPFSKLDMISCRNFLIYLQKETQKRVIELFQYALNPGGLLFLGSSENLGEADDLFCALDYKARLFKSKKGFGPARPVNYELFSGPLTSITSTDPLSRGNKKYGPAKPIREIAEQALLQKTNLTGVLVNRHGDILYLHGSSGEYLELAQGESGINNVLKMAKEGLRKELTMALHSAVTKNEVIERPDLMVMSKASATFVNISIYPVLENNYKIYGTPLYLIVFGQCSRPKDIRDCVLAHSELSSTAEAGIDELKQQLRTKEEYLQSAVEELETANEELCSSNEEMQSINEELQSTNEELETSREELQSTNEELTTVNAELQVKVGELSRLNNDMNNMLSGTGIATIFVDLRLCVLRFTPAVTEIINLIQNDIGRPIAHISSNMAGYNGLITDIQEVLHTLMRKEQKVRTKDGKWYAMRIQPYRTLENVIEGAVITFVDISEITRVKDALAVSEQRCKDMLSGARDDISES